MNKQKKKKGSDKVFHKYTFLENKYLCVLIYCMQDEKMHLFVGVCLGGGWREEEKKEGEPKLLLQEMVINSII